MDSSRTITLPESWVFTAANETKRTETNARVLCSSTLLGNPNLAWLRQRVVRRDSETVPLSPFQECKTGKNTKQPTRLELQRPRGHSITTLDTILSFFWPPTFLRVDVVPHNVGNNWHFWPPTYPSHLVHLVFERPPDDRSWSKKGARRGHTWTCLEFVGEFF